MTTGYFDDQPAIRALDALIRAAHEMASRVAPHTKVLKATLLQAAAIRLIPQAIHIAGSIRYELDGAMVLSAAILLRPLVERASTVTFLVANPNRVDDWMGGWKKKRPRLSDMVATLGDGLNEIGEREIIKGLHGLVHAGSDADWAAQVLAQDGTIAIAAHQMPGAGERAEYIAMFASIALLGMLVVIPRIFEDIVSKTEMDEILAAPIGYMLHAATAAIDKQAL